MRHLLDKILRPKKRQLIFFGLFCVPVVFYLLFIASLSWGHSFEDYLKVYYVGLLFLYVVTFLHDRYNKTSIKLYIYVFTLVLTFFSLISYPTRPILKNKSERQLQVLADESQKYYNIKGYYPDNFDDKFFKNAPKISYLGTKFFTEKYIDNSTRDTSFHISFLSLRGYYCVVDVKNKRLYYHD